MTERLLQQLEGWAAAATALAAALVWSSRPPLALGIAIGGAWNLASLWCLARLLNAWLGPRRSNRRVILWLVVKFPLLYLLAAACFRLSAASLMGFGIGFTASLAIVIGGFALQVPRVPQVHPHGR